MQLKVIRADQIKLLFWKNCRGTTHEIFIDPPDADFTENTFNFRLSSAQISESGAFSIFPGYRRWLILLEGQSLLLRSANDNHAESKRTLLTHELYSFDGSDQIFGELLDGPVRDLNFIASENLNVKCEIVNLSAGERRSLSGHSEMWYLIDGSVSVNEFCVKQAECAYFTDHKIENEQGKIANCKKAIITSQKGCAFLRITFIE